MRRAVSVAALVLLAACHPQRRLDPWENEPPEVDAEISLRASSEGRPVTGATVLTLAERPWAWRSFLSERARTDAKGEARFPEHAGRLWVRVLAPGFCEWEKTISLRAGLVSVDAALEREAPLSGVVVDPEGRPVNGACVSVERHELSDALTDAQGRFELRGARGGERYELGARAPGGEWDLWGQGRAVADSPASDVRIVLPETAALEVEILPPPGAEAPAMTLFVLERRGEDGGWTTSERSMGSPLSSWPPHTGRRFCAGQLEAGTYRLLARSPGLGVAQSGPIRLAPRERVRSRLQLEVGRSVRGRVVDGTDAPLRARVGWLVAAQPNSYAGRSDEVGWVETDPGGRFGVQELPRDACALVVVGLEGKWSRTIVAPPGAEILADVVVDH